VEFVIEKIDRFVLFVGGDSVAEADTLNDLDVELHDLLGNPTRPLLIEIKVFREFCGSFRYDDGRIPSIRWTGERQAKVMEMVRTHVFGLQQALEDHKP